MSTSVPVHVTTESFRGMYGPSFSAVFTPMVRDGKPFLHFPDQKAKQATGQYFVVRYEFNGQTEERVVMRAMTPAPGNAMAPAVGEDKRPLAFFLEQWTDADGVIHHKRIEGNQENQTIKYTMESGEDQFRRKRWHPSTPEEVFAARDKAVKARADYAQKKADRDVSAKSIFEGLAAALRGGNESMLAAVREMVDGAAKKPKG